MNSLMPMARRRRIVGVVTGLIGLLLAGGCHESSHYWILNDVSASLPMLTGEERPLRRAGTPAEMLEVRPGGGQVVLVAATIGNDPSEIDDEWAETFVVVLNGPLTVGTRYEITPDNGRLIRNAAWNPAREPYEPIEGRVEIKKIYPEGTMKVDCAFRSVLTGPYSESAIWRGTAKFEPPVAGQIELVQAGIAYSASE